MVFAKIRSAAQEVMSMRWTSVWMLLIIMASLILVFLGGLLILEDHLADSMDATALIAILTPIRFVSKDLAPCPQVD